MVVSNPYQQQHCTESSGREKPPPHTLPLPRGPQTSDDGQKSGHVDRCRALHKCTTIEMICKRNGQIDDHYATLFGRKSATTGRPETPNVVTQPPFDWRSTTDNFCYCTGWSLSTIARSPVHLLVSGRFACNRRRINIPQAVEDNEQRHHSPKQLRRLLRMRINSGTGTPLDSM